MSGRPDCSEAMPRRIFLTTDAVGGVWNYTLTLAEGLARSDCDCLAAVLGPAPSQAQRQQAAQAGLALVDTGLQLDWTAQSPKELVATACELSSIACEWRADSIHLHTLTLAAARWHAPVVVVSHSCMGTWWNKVGGSEIDFDMTWRRQVVLDGIARADCVIAPSSAFARDMLAVYGPISALRVVHNGVPLPDFAIHERARHGLCVGRLWDRGKNFETLDDAAANLPFELFAAGQLSGANGATFKPRHLASLGSLDSAALAHHYRTAAFFASSSRYEPFGLAVLEAAGHAMPLILSDIPTFRELWEGAACFVPEDDAAAWTETLESLMRSPQQRVELASLARARASYYTPERMVSATRKIHSTVHAASLAAA